ncbi:MAG TPA: hypothetical protein VMV83_18105 [Rectinemataceae bacterium]|nr:hypothetical protein [Rectinemataceae bacterium]
MTSYATGSPVVLIVFNRPDTTRRVFDAVRAARPRKLLVVADGPRQSKAGEAERCAEVRDIVSRVDWDCEVVGDFAEANQGCKRRVSSGIDWAFSLVERAIILEDDCLPSPSFFRFCDEMLERYAEDERVMLVSGDNRLYGGRDPKASYYFSRYPNIWGWATWRRAWAKFDLSMSAWPTIRKERGFDQYFGKTSERYYWKSMFNYVYSGHLDTWDYQWVYSIFKESGLCAVPERNLVRNIGFADDATHTTAGSLYAKLAAEELEFPLRHPDHMLIDSACDEAERRIRIRNVGMLPYPLNLFKDLLRDGLRGARNGA